MLLSTGERGRRGRLRGSAVTSQLWPRSPVSTAWVDSGSVKEGTPGRKDERGVGVGGTGMKKDGVAACSARRQRTPWCGPFSSAFMWAPARWRHGGEARHRRWSCSTVGRLRRRGGRTLHDELRAECAVVDVKLGEEDVTSME